MPRFTIDGKLPVYDVFHCRERYIGMVGPYYSRTGFWRVQVFVEGDEVPFSMLPDPRQFTMTVLAEIPRGRRQQEGWNVKIVWHKETLFDARVERHPQTTGRVAIATLARYDWPYIGEWIEHHRRLGIEHFYIYNHGEPKITAAVERFGPLVTEIPWTGGYALECSLSEPFWSPDSHLYTQPPQMVHTALKYGGGWDWLGFFDADEFLCPLGKEGLAAILDAGERGQYSELPYLRTACLRVQGKWFGTSGVKAPVPSVVAAYRRCEAGHTSGTKCFVRPEAVRASAVHYWDVEGQTGIVPDNVLRFNHYRAVSSFKRRDGGRYDAEYTNEASDDRLARMHHG